MTTHSSISPLDAPRAPVALVVDDSRAVRKLLSKLLARLGYRVLAAACAVEAEAVWHRESEVAVLLVDWNMPNVDGIGLIRLLRESGLHSACRILMVSSENRPERIMQALGAGADEFLMKPFDHEALESKLISAGAPQVELVGQWGGGEA